MERRYGIAITKSRTKLRVLVFICSKSGTRGRIYQLNQNVELNSMSSEQQATTAQDTRGYVV